MTLKEYASQKDPVRQFNVIVEKSECTISAPVRFADGKVCRRVYINRYGFEYLHIEGSDRLYTTDSDGNKRSSSCFRIKIDPEPKREKKLSVKNTVDCFPHLNWLQRQRLYDYEKLDYFSSVGDKILEPIKNNLQDDVINT